MTCLHWFLQNALHTVFRKEREDILAFTPTLTWEIPPTSLVNGWQFIFRVEM